MANHEPAVHAERARTERALEGLMDEWARLDNKRIQLERELLLAEGSSNNSEVQHSLI